MNWQEIKSHALNKVKAFGPEYDSRLQYEFKEIDKQGANDYWVNIITSGQKFEHNKNGLVLPFLLGVTDVDPIKSDINHVVTYVTDFPDVDTDLEPGTREKIEEYAAATYGRDKVCSVGLWQTYKPKLALQDTARAIGKNVDEVITLTKDLPEEFDELDLKHAIADFPQFRTFAENNRELVSMAYRMVGGIKAQGRHAGGLIISNVPVKEHIPLALCNGVWTSMWTEGRSPQLSKFGFVKFDMLGLKTLLYIKTCVNLIKQNKGVTIVWDDINYDENRAGWLYDNEGNKKQIDFNDKLTLKTASDLRTETVFQFETNLAKSILAKGGVKSIDDLIVYTSLGRPGPLPMIDTYIARRDGKENWKHNEHKDIIKILEKTQGVTTFQEQLADLWKTMAGFTVPETEKARKAVAKKWVDELKPIGEKWVKGASAKLGEKVAKEWWQRMETFGRYAFNKSHATAYVIVAHRCLYLKTYFPAEWWAAVMSDCDQDRLARYVNCAKIDGVQFGPININAPSAKFAVSGDTISPGLKTIKNMDSKFAEAMINSKHKFAGLDDFVELMGKSKIACERLIKLGTFDFENTNRKALWYWYQYRYGTDESSRIMRKQMKLAYMWPKDKIIDEINRQIDEFKKINPKKKIPPKIINWVPKTPWDVKEPEISDMIDETIYKKAQKIELTKDQVFKLAGTGYTLEEILSFEKEYLGYCYHSPMELFFYDTENSIAAAKLSGVLDAYVDKFSIRKKNTEFGELNITDGTDTARVMVWGSELVSNGNEIFKAGNGIRIRVKWNDKFKSFNMKSGSVAIPLERRRDAPTL